jgi:hypothetical protein
MAEKSSFARWSSAILGLFLLFTREVEAFASSHSSFYKALHPSAAFIAVNKRSEAQDPFCLYRFPISSSSVSCSLSTIPVRNKSVLARSDTLPNFSTAHGLLSPEVVMSIANKSYIEAESPLYTFLQTYKSQGPFACIFMLSDPKILSELTNAMRDVVESGSYRSNIYQSG